MYNIKYFFKDSLDSSLKLVHSYSSNDIRSKPLSGDNERIKTLESKMDNEISKVSI